VTSSTGSEPGLTDVPRSTSETTSATTLLDAYDVARAPRSDRPWVLCNLVATLDGRTAVYGRVGALSAPADQLLFHHLRGLADAILVGAGTVRAERYGQPRLTADVSRARRARGQLAGPRLCVVTRSFDLDGAREMLATAEPKPIVLTCDAAPPDRVFDAARHVDVISAGVSTVDLPRALAALRRHGIRVLLCEGGPTLNAELLQHDLVDELCVTIAPFLGGDALGLFERGNAPLQSLRITHAVTVEGSLFLRALVDRSAVP
jgi:riboflavin-specific deaminase-like protein